MGFVSELATLMDRYRFWETVYEYQQGLMYRFGTVIEKRIRHSKEYFGDIKNKENQAYSESGGLVGCLPFMRYLPIKKFKLPENYRSDFITGYPRHNDRFKKEKILKPGLYFFVPLFYEVVTDSIQDKVLDLANIGVISNGYHSKNGQHKAESVQDIGADNGNPEENILVSCNLVYNVMDINRAYNNVDDYKSSLGTHALSLLARHARKMSQSDWRNNDKILDLEKVVLEDLRKTATERWGLKIQGLFITENLPHDVKRLFHEGGFSTAIELE